MSRLSTPHKFKNKFYENFILKNFEQIKNSQPEPQCYWFLCSYKQRSQFLHLSMKINDGNCYILFCKSTFSDVLEGYFGIYLCIICNAPPPEKGFQLDFYICAPPPPNLGSAVYGPVLLA